MKTITLCGVNSRGEAFSLWERRPGFRGAVIRMEQALAAMMAASNAMSRVSVRAIDAIEALRRVS